MQKKKVLECIFHIQIQAVQLHKTQHHCAIVATSSRQASPHLLALLAPAAKGANLYAQSPVGGSSPSSPTETVLQLLLPLDSQVRPCQCSARALGLPGRGRPEGLTKPPNTEQRQAVWTQVMAPASFLKAPHARLPKLCTPWKTKTEEGRSLVNGISMAVLPCQNALPSKL